MKMEEALRRVVDHLADEGLPREVALAVAQLRKSLDKRRATREAGEAGYRELCARMDEDERLNGCGQPCAW